MANVGNPDREGDTVPLAGAARWKRGAPSFALQGAALAVTLLAGAAGTRADPDSFSVEDYVRGRLAVEEVLWRHRIWPRENPGPKPALDGATAAAIRERSLDELRQAVLLARRYHRSLPEAELQAELDRMAASSKDPALLRELFAALGGDPARIGLCLVRPILVARQIQGAYAWDRDLHLAVESTARRQAGFLTGALRPPLHGVSYGEQVIRWDRTGISPSSVGGEGSVLGKEDWEAEVQRLAAMISPRSVVRSALDLPVGVPGSLQEDDTRFYVMEVRSRDADRLVVAFAAWPKEPFGSFWSRVRDAYPLPPSLPAPALRMPALTAPPCTDDTWSSTLVETPNGRERHTAVWTGSEMIVWGGTKLGYRTNTGARYRPATDSWVATSLVGAPTKRVDHRAVWTGTRMVVWGGGDPYTGLATGGRYDPVSDSWQAVQASGNPGGRRLHSAVWTGTEMVVWGGLSGTDPTYGYYGNGGRYDPAADSWTFLLGSNPPSARWNHTAVWTGSRMVVWGGQSDFYNFTGLNTGGIYDIGTDAWTATTLNGVPAGRTYHTAVWTGTEMIVWGGGDDFNYFALHSGGRLDPTTNTSWTATSLTGAPEARKDHTAIWTGTAMVVWGGYDGASMSTGARYTPSSDSWAATSTTGAPSPRRYQSAIWTGTEMIVWGGGVSQNTGGRYDPASDQWTPTAVTSPNGVAEPSAVWTGAEMVVWGGGLTYSSAGWRYLPATNGWVPISSSGAPAARMGAPAVWTGTRMLVWGGLPSSATAGGRYDPAADLWTSMSTTGQPVMRRYHTTVWTGTRMVVWGGYDSNLGTTLGDGGRYDPQLNVWQTTSNTGAAAARQYHTAVWTGREMIVHGGSDGAGVPLDTGGRYDPEVDGWQALPASGAARSWHTAQWTGRAMIVWGGVSSVAWLSGGMSFDPLGGTWTSISTAGAPSGRGMVASAYNSAELCVWGGYNAGALGTGARYSPAADNWTTMSPTGAPTPRYNTTAVWTGAQFIVWGGFDTTMYLESGGVYCACVVPDTLGFDLLRGSKGPGTVVLTWAPGWPGVAGYNVYRDAVPDSPWGPAQLLTPAPIASTTFVDTPPAGDFYYKIRAVGGCGDVSAP